MGKPLKNIIKDVGLFSHLISRTTMIFKKEDDDDDDMQEKQLDI